MHRVFQAPCLVLAFGLVAASAALAQRADLDRYEVTVERPPRDVTVFVGEFSTDGADIGTAEKEGKKKAQETVAVMRSVAPPALIEAFVNRLSEHGAFAAVTALEAGAELPANALLVDGEFTVLNPGSRGKRYWVGMGAGKSRICVAGRVVTAAGEELATFDHCRSGNIGWFGGDASGMMATDVHQTAVRLADWMAAWAVADPPIRTKRK